MRRTAHREMSIAGVLLVVRCRLELAAEDAIADYGVEQHKREDEESCAPEHESKAEVGAAPDWSRDPSRYDRQVAQAASVGGRSVARPVFENVCLPLADILLTRITIFCSQFS